MTVANITIPKEEIAEFCKRHHITKLSLFGSVLRDDFGPDSDIDVLVEFAPKSKITFFDLFRFEEELSGLLGGVKVDMRSPEDLSRFFREDVLRKAEPIYE